MEARGVIRGEYGPAILDSYGPERHGVGPQLPLLGAAQ